ncbi:hypothetical protein HON36_00335 [Candidatus Parcubacteria bacterium]|jgi:hypothetical protein|nr:hypothetical protein [Candidatus Parcubacteria bacterium]MBT7228593.1 hypothetical protein [Candidatus Parcubacteria bacterium]
MNYFKFPEKAVHHIASIPFVYLMVFPIVILDIFLEIYHQICFRLYDLPLVPRGAYIKIDRHRLEYLDNVQKINCVYCGYSNGLIKYAMVIFAETEAYWCGIQHKEDDIFKAPDHHKSFLPHGDRDYFEEKIIKKLKD